MEYLDTTAGSVFITTGSKELAGFTKLRDYRERCYVRVLPISDVVASCEKMGFKTANLICMQGPFNKELNLAMLKSCGASYMVTKESGTRGGFKEKVEAALIADAKVLVIGRPAEYGGESHSLDEMIGII